MNRTIRLAGTALLAAVWAGLALFAWFLPAKETSDAERRPLAQMPELTAESLINRKFMEGFEEYALDQFPMRDGFRRIKSLFHYYGLNQSDNNRIYIADGYAAEMEYPLDEASVIHALSQFQKVYDRYLAENDCRIYTAIVPDKGYYLAEENGYLSMDYDRLFGLVRQYMPWSVQVDLTEKLRIGDYYFTDTHWRQEKLFDVATTLSRAMGITAPRMEGYTAVEVERPFYGVYYGQAALPMDPDTMYILQSDLLEDCRVYNFVTDSYGDIYDMERLTGKDMYEVYLSGAQSLLRIENPNALTDRELVVFRDSFGSSLVPLLVQDYASVTLVDIRYIQVGVLGRYVDFENADVLFLYSTLVLNKKLI